MSNPFVTHQMPSYDHLMGSPKKAHMGSQSKTPEGMHSGHPMKKGMGRGK